MSGGVVFVLGAGASVCSGAPVMKNFFQKSKHLRRKRRLDIYAADFEAVNYARDVLRRAKIKSRLDIDNLEEIFTALEMVDTIGGIDGLSAEEACKAQKSLKNLIAITLEQSIQYPVTRDKNGGVSVQPTYSYSRLASEVNDIRIRNPSFPITFLTFNYDIAFDYALYHTKARVDYCLDSKKPANRHIRYCKLHGSLHWALERESKKIVGSNLDFSSMFNNHSDMLETKYVCMRVEKNQWNKDIVSDSYFPFIVPPTGNKPYLHSLLKPVWTQAAMALKNAEIIFVIGYSFPQTDQFFRNFFALGTIGPTDLERIILIDPGEYAHKELCNMVSPDLHSNIEYLKKTFEESIDDISLVLSDYLSEW